LQGTGTTGSKNSDAISNASLAVDEHASAAPNGDDAGDGGDNSPEEALQGGLHTHFDLPTLRAKDYALSAHDPTLEAQPSNQEQEGTAHLYLEKIRQWSKKIT
jgi:hypothetical protein